MTTFAPVTASPRCTCGSLGQACAPVNASGAERRAHLLSGARAMAGGLAVALHANREERT